MVYKFNGKKYKNTKTLKNAMAKEVKFLNELINEIGASPARGKDQKQTKKRIITEQLTKRNEYKENQNNLKKFKIKSKKQPTEQQKYKYMSFTIKLYKEKDDERRRYKNHEYHTDKTGKEHVRIHTLNINVLKKYMDKYAKYFYRFISLNDDKVKVSDLLDVMEKDINNKSMIVRLRQSGDISGVHVVNYNVRMQKVTSDYDVFKEIFNLDNENKTISSKYTKYEINKDAKNFKELIQTEKNDYIKNNFHPNSCFMTAIINKFYDKFNNKNYKELTYESLAKHLKIDYKPNGYMGLTINQVVETFFTKFKFAALKIYDPFMNLLLHHDNERKQDTIILRIIVNGNHIYEMNSNLKSLQELEKNRKIDYSDKLEIKVSNKFTIIEDTEEKKNKRKTSFVKTSNNIMNKMMKKIKKHSENDKYDMIKIVTNHELNDLVIDIYESGYIPKIFFNNFIYKISFDIQHKKKSKNIQICCVDSDPVYGQLINSGEMIIDSKAKYSEYDEVFNKLYRDMIKSEHLSEYNDDTIEILDKYKIFPCVGNFEQPNENEFFSIIDMNKAYTNQTIKIKKVPVYNYFDVFMNYNNEPIEKLTEYVVELLNKKDSLKNIFSEKITRLYGFVLNKLNKNDYKIHKFRKPSYIKEVDFKSPIEELYKNDNMTTPIKKHMVNKITGIFEMNKNTSHLTKIFNNYDEAKYYSIKYKADEPRAIIKYHTDIKIVVDENGNKETVCKPDSKKDVCLYIVNIQEKKRLINGLQPIKDVIYQMQKLDMYELYNKMTQLNFEIMGTKTDCFYYRGNTELLIKNFPINNEIGNFKIEHDKQCPDKPLQIIDNELIEMKDFADVKIKTFKDEYKTKSINRYIKENRVIMIEGLYPGVGKSTLAKNFDKDGLFICPYNKLCQVLRSETFKAQTYNKLFGVFFKGEDNDNKKMKQLDIENQTVIVFDEIYLYDPERLKKIDRMIRNNPDKIFLATGDCDQRDPVGYNNSEYIKHCINCIFKNKIVLKDIKRLKCEEDKKKWKLRKKDIFESDLSVEEICKQRKIKIVRRMQDVKTTKNVAFFNKCRTTPVNNFVHFNLLKKKEKFYVGLEVICKEHIQKKTFVLHTNYSYKITKYTKDKVEIKDELDDIVYTISHCELDNKFALPYCFTCDSIQGLSFKEEEKVTIFDANIPHTDKKYLWTAITRARQLKNVSVFIHNEEEVERLKFYRMKRYFKNKTEGYKQQDKAKNRTYINHEFVDYDWMMRKLKECKFQCTLCNSRFTLDVNNGNFNSNITVDRIDNKLAHIKSNCQMACLHCNVSKK